MSFFWRCIKSEAPASVCLIRLMVGGVFLSEGLQKFIFPADLGAGRFAKIGLPAPELFAQGVGAVETVGGLLILLGLGTRFAAIPLICVMLGAIVSTKIPIFFNKGLWSMLHEARTDYAMLLGSLFLLINGAGRIALDNLVLSRRFIHRNKS